MENCSVGPFKLPGIVFEKDELPESLLGEMQEWAKAEGVGMSMTERLWSFKKEAHREWFILRWSDHIPKREDLKLEPDFSQQVKDLVGSIVVKSNQSV